MCQSSGLSTLDKPPKRHGSAGGRGSKSKISILLLCLGAAFVGFAARNLSLALSPRACSSFERRGAWGAVRRAGRSRSEAARWRPAVAGAVGRRMDQLRGSFRRSFWKRGRSSPAAPFSQERYRLSARGARPACLEAPSAPRGIHPSLQQNRQQMSAKRAKQPSG